MKTTFPEGKCIALKSENELEAAFIDSLARSSPSIANVGTQVDGNYSSRSILIVFSPVRSDPIRETASELPREEVVQTTPPSEPGEWEFRGVVAFPQNAPVNLPLWHKVTIEDDPSLSPSQWRVNGVTEYSRYSLNCFEGEWRKSIPAPQLDGVPARPEGKWRLLEDGEFCQKGDEYAFAPRHEGISLSWIPIGPSEWGGPCNARQFIWRRPIHTASEKPYPMGTEARVCQYIGERQRVGLRKYGVSVEESPLASKEWRAHLKAELADALIYLTREEEEDAKTVPPPSPGGYARALEEVASEQKRKADALESVIQAVRTGAYDRALEILEGINHTAT